MPTIMNSLQKAPNLGRMVCLLGAISFFTVFMHSETQAQKTKRQPEVTLSAEHAAYPMGAEITLTFTVSNPHAKKVKFCRYHTPIEGIKNNILEVIHPNGETIRYMGPMVKRREPTKEDHMKVKGGQSVMATFILNQTYPINDPGTYSIQFKGAEVNQLPDSNVLKIELTGK